METINQIFFLLLLLCPVKVLLSPVGEAALNEIEDNYDDTEDDTTSNSTLLTDEEDEALTVSPSPKILVPPASAGQKAQKNSKSQTFEENKNFYDGQMEIWPKKVFNDQQDIAEMTAYCYDSEIDLFLRFSGPFNGYIYPFHHFRKCHLFTGDAQTEVNLLITEDSCGLDVTYGAINNTIQFLEFTFMIQWEKDFITQNDRKLRVTCNRAESNNKTVYLANSTEHFLSPAITMSVDNEDDDDDYDDEEQEKPSRAYDPVRVGEEVTVTINVHSAPSGSYDANVVQCLAHDGPNGLNGHHLLVHTYDDSKTKLPVNWEGSKVLLSNGCSNDESRFSNFDKDVINGALEMGAVFHVFKFPSSHFVFLECQVQVCLGKCPGPTSCSSKLKVEVSDSSNIKTITVFRPLMVKISPLMGLAPLDGDFEDHAGSGKQNAPQRGVPTAGFIAGLVGMGFVCAIICVFMYRRFKKGTEKDYTMQYSPNADGVGNSRHKEEVAPLKVTPNEAAE